MNSKPNESDTHTMNPAESASIKWQREGDTKWSVRTRLVTVPNDLLRDIIGNIKAVQHVIENANPPLMYILDEHRMCPLQKTSFYTALEMNLMDLKTILKDFTKTGSTP